MYIHLSSSYKNTIPAYAINNPPPGIGSEIVESVDGYTTVDLSGSYQYRGHSELLSGVSITAGVRNAFDEDFPAINLVAGRVLPFDPRRVDVRGRVTFIEIGKKFN
jgi:outer membrane receptor protein involved in Fe transport